jgi:hypothetical protein
LTLGKLGTVTEVLTVGAVIVVRGVRFGVVRVGVVRVGVVILGREAGRLICGAEIWGRAKAGMFRLWAWAEAIRARLPQRVINKQKRLFMANS